MDLQEFLHVYDEPHTKHDSPGPCLSCLLTGGLLVVALENQDTLLGQLIVLGALRRQTRLTQQYAAEKYDVATPTNLRPEWMERDEKARMEAELAEFLNTDLDG